MSELVTRFSHLNKINICGAWSDSDVIFEAADHLKGCRKVLDIGSGVGKFCLLAASENPDTHFVGVEQHIPFFKESKKIQKKLGFKNVTFINDDYLNIDISEYDGIYIFNPFVMTKKDPNGSNYQRGRKIEDEEYTTCIKKFQQDLYKTKLGTKLVMCNPFCSVKRDTGFVYIRTNSNCYSSRYRFYRKNGTQISNSK